MDVYLIEFCDDLNRELDNYRRANSRRRKMERPGQEFLARVVRPHLARCATCRRAIQDREAS